MVKVGNHESFFNANCFQHNLRTGIFPSKITILVKIKIINLFFLHWMGGWDVFEQATFYEKT